MAASQFAHRTHVNASRRGLAAHETTSFRGFSPEHHILCFLKNAIGLCNHCFFAFHIHLDKEKETWTYRLFISPNQTDIIMFFVWFRQLSISANVIAYMFRKTYVIFSAEVKWLFAFDENECIYMSRNLIYSQNYVTL